MGENVNILVVEDDTDINSLLCNILTAKGYGVRSAYSGSEAMMCLNQYKYQLVVLDLMLPGVSGEDIIKEVRKSRIMPIIVVSAKTSQEDKINALNLGADDFIAKPFETNEVLARVEAQLRRYLKFNKENNEDSKITLKNLVLDRESKEVTVCGKKVSLTVIEFSILELLLTSPNKVFTRSNIFESVWKDDFMGDDNTVNVHVSNLRTKLLKADSKEEYIKTVWGIGFKISD